MRAALAVELISIRVGEAPKIAADVAIVRRISAVPVILRVLCDTTGLGFGAIARVTETSWTACAVVDRNGSGLHAGDQLDVSTTLCHEVLTTRRPIIIEEVSEHSVYRDHPTPKRYGFESYIAVPIIRRTGEFFGTICARDRKPAVLPEAKVLPTLQLFAELIAAQIDVEEQRAISQSALVDANAVGVLRDQFIAVLGHDLRNPIGAVTTGLDWLSRRLLDDKAATLVGQLRQSCWRMSELVDNILDFARGTLGGGIPVERRQTADLAATLLHIVDELQASHRDRHIRFECDLSAPVYCDPQRIGQLLSNLLANALTHGASDKPVHVRASIEANQFRLDISNEGPPIPPETLKRLFQPFSHAGNDAAPAGLGLGLYIAYEIARSHGGNLRVASTADETVFTLKVPAHPPGRAPIRANTTYELAS